MSSYTPWVRRLWTAAGDKYGASLTGAGTKLSDSTNLIYLKDVCDVSLYVAVTAATGTNPTLDVQLDVQDAAGTWFTQITKITQIASGPATQIASAGLRVGTTSLVLPEYGRVSITLGGTNPAYTGVSITLYGR